MSSHSTTFGRWMPALAAMIAIQMMLAAAARTARAADTVIYTFGFGSSIGTTCSNLDGADPEGSLTFANDLLFGRTASTTGKGNLNGIIFHIDPAGSNYTIDHQFTGGTTDGSNPRNSSMTLDGTVLYGTTLAGGLNNNGTIFSINDDGTGYSTPPLFSFAKTVAKNKGDQPASCFALNNGGVLFGMTSAGGSKNGPPGDGTVFSFDPQTSTYTRLHSFGGSDGSVPHGQPILDPNGVTLYGMTQTGGLHNVGVIYSLGPSKSCNPLKVCPSTFKTLHSFSCPQHATPMCVDPNDGASPDHGNLVQSGTTLYGLTAEAGKFGLGTLFSLQLTGSKKFKILHSFGTSSIDGANPLGSLLLSGNTLYGTTSAGGSPNLGTVFQINTDGTNYTRLHIFQGGTDGANPIDNVILVNNTLYGMTSAGGQCSHGVIFSVALP